MNVFVIKGLILLFGIIAIYVCYVILIKWVPNLVAQLISPLKRLYLFEHKMLRCIVTNILYPQKYIFPSLKNDDFIGVPNNINLPQIKSNPIIRNILFLLIQLFIIRIVYLSFFSNNSFYKQMNLIDLLHYEIITNKNKLLLLLISLVFGVIAYIIFMIKKVDKTENAFFISTIGEPIKPEIIKNLLSATQIIAYLTTGSFKSSAEINSAMSSHKYSWKLLLDYYNELKNTKNKESLFLAFNDIFSIIYQHRDIKASVVELGHGGITLIEHSLNVAEYGLSLFSNDVYKNHENAIKDILVFTCLAHDLGKIICFTQGYDNYNKHEILSQQLLNSLESFGNLKERDFILELVNNQHETFIDQAEDLVIANHMFRTADTKASEREGLQVSEDEILGIYRIAFYDFLRDKAAVNACCMLVSGFIFISIHEFVKEMLKITKQTFTVSNYANTQVFKHISTLFMKDNLYPENFKNRKCHIVFIDKKTNLEIKRFSECIILKYDFVLDNESLDDKSIEIKLQGRDLVAKVLIKEGEIVLDKKHNDLGITKINTPDVDVEKNMPDFIDNPLKKPREEKEENTTVISPIELGNISVLDKNIQFPESQKPPAKYKKITLEELEAEFLKKLRSLGFIISKIEFETEDFVRCAVEGKSFEAGAYKAYIKGVPNLSIIIHRTRTYNNQEPDIEYSDNYKLAGIDYNSLGKEYEIRLENEKLQIKELQMKLKNLEHLYTADGDSSIFQKLNIDEAFIVENLGKNLYKGGIFTRSINNMEDDQINGYIQIINNDILEQKFNDKYIDNPYNYVILNNDTEISNLKSALLIDNIIDGLYLYFALKIPVVITFNFKLFIEKLKEYGIHNILVATKITDLEEALAIYITESITVVNPFGLFEKHTKGIDHTIFKDRNYYFYQMPEILGISNDDYLARINSQLKYNQRETIENANKFSAWLKG